MTAHFNTEVWLSPIHTVAPSNLCFHEVHCGLFWDQFPMGNTEYSEEGKVPEATCYRGYGMYCQRSLLQFTSDILRENLTCFTFTILDICRSVQQVFLFCLFCLFLFSFFPTSASQHPLQVWKDKKSQVNLIPLDRSLHCGPASWPSLSRCVMYVVRQMVTVVVVVFSLLLQNLMLFFFFSFSFFKNDKSSVFLLAAESFDLLKE